MIKINLLPTNLRKAKKNPTRMRYLPIVFLGGALFGLLTLFFYVDFLKVNKSYAMISREYKRLSPFMAQLKTLEKKIEIDMKSEKEFLDKNILNTDSITMIMVRVSEFLPAKGWLTEFKAERDGEGCRVTLQGVVLPNQNQTGIEEIENYLHKLKEKLPPQASLQLTTSKDTKMQQGTSFTAHFEWGLSKKT